MLHRLCLPGTVVKLPTFVCSIGCFEGAVQGRKLSETIFCLLLNLVVDLFDVFGHLSCSLQGGEDENEHYRHHPNFHPIPANWQGGVWRIILHVFQNLFFSLVDDHRIAKCFALGHLRKITSYSDQESLSNFPKQFVHEGSSLLLSE